jgi:hypothetical protein
MPNRLYYPYINPIKFHEINPVNIPQFISKHMDSYPFKDTILRHEQDVCFKQPWTVNDSIRLQVESNYAPIELKMFRCSDNAELYSQTFDTRQQNLLLPDFYIRQIDVDLAAYPADVYYFTINDSLISEPFEVLEDAHNTLLVEYSHYEKYGGVRFSSPFNPSIRIPGSLKYNTTGSKDVIYEDEPLNETMINSVNYRIMDFILGTSEGMPPWFSDKVKRIFGCSELKIDGRLYTKAEGSTWERVEEDYYPMQGWKIQLREKTNRDFLIYDDEVVIPGIAAAALIIDTKGFGIDDQSGNDYLEIQNVI